MSEAPEPIVYQLKVVLLGISPMIWRRLLVCGDSTTISDLHYIIQIAMGWSDDHLNRLRIHGKQYGIARLGGLTFSDDPDTVRLKNFRFRVNERFLYEYDFTDGWQHQIRVEKILAHEPHRSYPVCTGGNRACPPEDCGGPWRFMALRQHYSLVHIMERLLEIIEDAEIEEGYSKRFAFVHNYDDKPKRRVFEMLRSQGMQMNQQVTFLSDGADTVRDLQLYLNPNAQHILDWFHMTMRLTVMRQLAKWLGPPGSELRKSAINQVVSKRMVKKRQMRWSQKGAHLLLQIRTRVLNGELQDEFRKWYPSFDQGGEELPLAA